MAPLIILMYALFSTSFSAGKILLQYTSPIFLVGVRFFLAGSILLFYQFGWRKKRVHIKRNQLWLYAQIIILGIYAAYVFRFFGLKYLSSSKTAFLFNSSPFFTAIYSYIFFNDRMTKKQWIGLVIGFIGLIPILLTSSPIEQEWGEFLFISWPELAILISVALHSYSWIVVRKLVRDKQHTPLVVNSITMFGGGLLALITAPFVEGIAPMIKPMDNLAEFVGWLLFVVIISNIICYNLYGHLLKKYSPTFLSFSGFLVPIFAALYGWGLLSEKITWHFYASCLIVFVGLYLFYQDEFKQTASFYQ